MSQLTLSNLIDRAIFGNHLALADQLHDSFALLEGIQTPSKYPPSNIIQMGDNEWIIQMAVAGFTEPDLSVQTLKNNLLQVSGTSPPDKFDDNGTYLKRGIGLRSFTETYRLAEGASVTDVSLENGLLTIKIVRVIPEDQKPKQLQIRT